MKKTLIISLFVLLTLGLFVSCKPEPKAEEKVTITVKNLYDTETIGTVEIPASCKKWSDIKDLPIQLKKDGVEVLWALDFDEDVGNKPTIHNLANTIYYDIIFAQAEGGVDPLTQDDEIVLTVYKNDEL